MASGHPGAPINRFSQRWIGPTRCTFSSLSSQLVDRSSRSARRQMSSPAEHQTPVPGACRGEGHVAIYFKKYRRARSAILAP
jgi:hypothetical protein